MSDFLYVIATHNRRGNPDGPCKVGIATNLVSRLKTIQTGSPRKLGYFAIWDFTGWECSKEGGFAVALERGFHTLQRKDRLTGEWYGMAPQRAAYILEIYLRSALVLEGLVPREDKEKIPAYGLICTPRFDRRGRPRVAA